MNVWAAYLAIGVIVAGLVAPLAWLSGRRFQRFLARRPTWAASLNLAPVALAALFVAALVCPRIVGTCHCLAMSTHPHLCLAHPDQAAPLLSVAGAILVATALWSVPRMASAAWRFLKAEVAALRMRRVPVRSVGGVDVRVCDCPGAGAFTVGLISPIVVFDRALWDELSEDDRLAIAAHEDGHRRRRDPLTLAILSLSTTLLPTAWATSLVELWRRSAELYCDDLAAHHVGSRTAVARALIRAEALLAGRAAPVAALGATGTSLEVRVHNLLSANTRHAQWADANDAILVGTGLAVLLVIVASMPSGGLHHEIEHLLTPLL